MSRRLQSIATALLFWASFILITGHARTAYADTVIDIRPDGSIIRATHNGSLLDVPLNVRLYQSETHQGQHVTFKVYYGVVGYQPNGEELIVWRGDASVYPNGDGRLGYWGMMTDTPSGTAYYYQPLSLDPGDAMLTAGFDLYDELNQPTSISTISEGHRLTIGESQPPVRSTTALFDFLSDYFAGSLLADVNGDGVVGVGDIFDFLMEYL